MSIDLIVRPHNKNIRIGRSHPAFTAMHPYMIGDHDRLPNLLDYIIRQSTSGKLAKELVGCWKDYNASDFVRLNMISAVFHRPTETTTATQPLTYGSHRRPNEVYWIRESIVKVEFTAMPTWSGGILQSWNDYPSVRFTTDPNENGEVYVISAWHYKGLLHRSGSKPALITETLSGDRVSTIYALHGDIIDNGDIPAVHTALGDMYFNQSGVHRAGAKEAIVLRDELGKTVYTAYIRRGRFHLTNGPAVINQPGAYIEWWKDGLQHREGAPAVEKSDGEEWFINGKLHRKDGPAVITEHDHGFFYHGKRFDNAKLFCMGVGLTDEEIAVVKLCYT